MGQVQNSKQAYHGAESRRYRLTACLWSKKSSKRQMLRTLSTLKYNTCLLCLCNVRSGNYLSRTLSYEASYRISAAFHCIYNGHSRQREHALLLMASQGTISKSSTSSFCHTVTGNIRSLPFHLDSNFCAHDSRHPTGSCA